MSSYRYELKNYHAIKSASIELDGITVLAGENGCGKSTLSKWLYYLVNASCRYEEFACKYYADSLDTILRRLERLNREVRLSVPKQNQSELVSFPSSSRPNRIVENKYDEKNFLRFSEFVNDTIELFAANLEIFLNTVNFKSRQNRILSYLHIKNEGLTPEQIVEQFRENFMQHVQSIVEDLHSELETRPVSGLYRTIHYDYNEKDTVPKSIQLYEDNVGVVNKNSVFELYNLRRAIYIDTPLALSYHGTDNLFWDELRNYIAKNNVNQSGRAKKIAYRIKNILSGDVRLVEDNSLFEDDGELRFYSTERDVDIEIEKTATGFKTFIYLLRLLENGYLNNETLLLIDEPEVHLHPQWIVEYARLLVLLHKELGLKVVLASHNPDMVAAIRSISEREGTLRHTHFYIASPVKDSFKYSYIDLGTDIEEIFVSFNIALSRIQSYGAGSL